MPILVRRRIISIPTYSRWNIVLKAAINKHDNGVKIRGYNQQVSHRISI
jgi:hypothetical protein